MFLKLVGWTAVLLSAAVTSPEATPRLKDAYSGKFVVGAAINRAQITGSDKMGATLTADEFNSISPENALKWESIHPSPGIYSFDLPDQYVAFGEKHKMFVVGHTLVWHNQTPDWVFHDEKGKLVTRDVLLNRMHEHIATVVGRYKGRIQSWDVVNEALNDDGSLRQSLWLKIIGEDYVEKAFQYAHEADPNVQLAYNDYSLENPSKRKGALALLKKLKGEGVPITTVGMQGHLSLQWPAIGDEEETVKDFADVGVKVAISELDVDVLPKAGSSHDADVSRTIRQDPVLNPYAAGLSDAVQQELATRYQSLFRVYLKHSDSINRVTFWGATDADSWLNNWPIRGRTSYPLLFDRSGQPKPAYRAVVDVVAPASK